MPSHLFTWVMRCHMIAGLCCTAWHALTLSTLQQVMAPAAPVQAPLPAPLMTRPPSWQRSESTLPSSKGGYCTVKLLMMGCTAFVGNCCHHALTPPAVLVEPAVVMGALLMCQVAAVLAALRKVPGAREQLPVWAVMHGRQAVVAPHPHML